MRLPSCPSAPKTKKKKYPSREQGKNYAISVSRWRNETSVLWTALLGVLICITTNTKIFLILSRHGTRAGTKEKDCPEIAICCVTRLENRRSYFRVQSKHAIQCSNKCGYEKSGERSLAVMFQVSMELSLVECR